MMCRFCAACYPIALKSTRDYGHARTARIQRKYVVRVERRVNITKITFIKIRFVNRIKISILELFCFRLPYSFSTGGCLALNHTIVEAINGYSNLMPGWGGEDDQIYARCVQTKAASSMECLRQICPLFYIDKPMVFVGIVFS